MGTIKEMFAYEPLTTLELGGKAWHDTLNEVERVQHWG